MQPRPLFVYGTLRALPLLAWALTGDPGEIDMVKALVKAATVSGYNRFRLHHCDYPAVVASSSSESQVDGYLLNLETLSQRRKLDDFEGETYVSTAVVVKLNENGSTVEADMYTWDGDAQQLSDKPWSLEWFIQERLKDWIEIFVGMELVG
ncbi:Butirosin biosynthesis, BtrG-like protein [Pterulicium gracile]|uniref:Putative gamma-glutamylcyclotransferase n=1 Tax=Pterulicium gracile TaxID=1884261 RepID=A0A5C3Q4F1_9AGAR|nr:Butirosin biosynthesis, BtrG-like protein [Pterula gracilis]